MPRPLSQSVEPPAKSLLKSKTFWVNVFALVATIVQAFTGFVVPPEWQGYALTVVNVGLRLVTNQAVGVW